MVKKDGAVLVTPWMNELGDLEIKCRGWMNSVELSSAEYDVMSKVLRVIRDANGAMGDLLLDPAIFYEVSDG